MVVPVTSYCLNLATYAPKLLADTPVLAYNKKIPPALAGFFNIGNEITIILLAFFVFLQELVLDIGRNLLVFGIFHGEGTTT